MLSVFILSISCSELFAQEKKVALGLGISPTINWLNAKSNGLESNGAKIGFTYGLMSDFNFGENYALATGLFINSSGGKVGSVELIDSLEKTINTNYKIQSILIPLTLRMRTKEIGYLKYYGQFGFNPELVINARADVDSEGEESKDDIGVMESVVDMNLSLVLGLGIEYNLSGTTNILIGLSYHNGFINRLKGRAGGFNPEDKSATSNQIALNLGVLF